MRLTFRELIESQDNKKVLRLGIKALEYKLKITRMERKHRPNCGAKTRKGTPCKAKVYWPYDWDAPAKRCQMHGGLSTGPKTEEGMERLAKSAKENMERIWRERREGTRPMPRKRKAEPLELEMASWSSKEFAVLEQAAMEILNEKLFDDPLFKEVAEMPHVILD